MPYRDALDHIKKRRPIISPNPGFHAQLELFENMKYQVDHDHDDFRKFRELDYDPDHDRVTRHEHAPSWKDLFRYGRN